ncbi:type III-A CRISPR-associated RAMP protein Csm3 [Sulfuricurvum sp.]|uniref:type III-A CRISPR-associated RAMP protein Csm3 n=1 Tax=Sulfuricurvum sp. TaxID=2025608 RepID=UPI002601CEA3|nr:type III-A CRISPR-associated RAMP protein Csm3 [Sulfuricurvum sp.]MDD3596351.1 type III-A CRISPR-associated RAMP protein Csm3 [Sulfuricurvum sp.]
MQLTDIVTLTGTIRLASGLHIGGGDQAMQIGSIDNPVIKHPNTRQPFIPGSSLKGKLRTLLEHKLGVSQFNNGNPADAAADYRGDKTAQENAKKIAKLFGNGDPTYKNNRALSSQIGPSRGVFADAMLSKIFIETIEDNSELVYFGTRTTTSINRLSGTAKSGLHTSEHVPEGIVFDFTVSIKILETSDYALVDLLVQGLRLLELDYLGGYGSRGYGKIIFENITMTKEGESKTIELPLNPFA